MSESGRRGQTEPLSLEALNDYLDSGVSAVIALGTDSAHELRIDPRHRELVLTSPADGSFEDRGDLRNLAVDLDETSDPPRYILTVKVEDYPDAAASLTQTIVRSIQAGSSYAASLDRALEDFRALLRRKRRMSEAQETGLYGELLLLDQLIDAIGPRGAVESWVGPAAEEHDFVLTGYDLEVKTTTSEARKHVIHGPGQLLPRPRVPLWLLSIQVTRAGGAPGRSLTDLARSVLGRLGSQATRARKEMDSSGWREDDASLYTERRTLRTTARCYRVNAEFPAVTPDLLAVHIPNGSLISDLRYTIDVSGLPYGVPGDEIKGFAEEP